MPDMVQVLSDLGGTLGSLLAAFIYIWHLQKSFQIERDTVKNVMSYARKHWTKEPDGLRRTLRQTYE